MNLSELATEVYKLTARPDKVSETSSAIKSATLKAHQSDFYWKDIFESGIVFDSEDYVQNLDYRALLPRWRALKYLRKYDLSSNTPFGTELSIIVPENIFDEYGLTKTNICYAAGAFIQINSSTKQQAYLLGCYLNPDLTDAGYSSWVALDHPWFIIYEAAGQIFKSIGKDDEATTFRTLGAEQLAMLKTSNILAQGF